MDGWMDGLIDLRHHVPDAKAIENLISINHFVRRSKERVEDLVKRMMNLVQLLIGSNGHDEYAHLSLQFIDYLMVMRWVQPSLIVVFGWIMKRIQEFGKRKKISPIAKEYLLCFLRPLCENCL
jgi:hypothetical protein